MRTRYSEMLVSVRSVLVKPVLANLVLVLCSACCFYACSPSVRYATRTNTTYASRAAITHSSGEESSLELRQKIISEAEKYVGRGYCYGGTGPDCYDCSGFVSLVFSKFSIGLSRTAALQMKQGTLVTVSELQPGDLIFFDFDGRGEATHVALYCGEGVIVHAASSSGVRKETFGDSLLAKVCGFRSLIP